MSRPGIALPIRIHDLLLTLAGRLDDDALADARQMLAQAELDRSLEFVAGCLAAGRVVLTHEQHAELAGLFADTYLDPSVIDRVMVTDRLNVGRHRFAFGAVDGRDPERGVADAVRPVLGVLPDVRSMWCVWRLTPAGPSSGPVPHLMVLVGIGPGGFAPATGYRVEDALRRAGIRASVEVLMDGLEPGEYHREAMRNARQIPFDGPGFNRPRVEPAYEAARIAPARVEAPRMTPPAPEPPRLEPARVASVPRVEPEPALDELPEPEPVRPQPPLRGEQTVRAEPVRPEPLRAERAEPLRAERAEPLRAEPLMAEPLRAEPLRAEPVRPEPLRAERAEPLRAEPLMAEPLRAEPLRAEPLRAEPLRAEPLRAEPLRAESSRAEPLRDEPLRPEPLRPEPPRMSVVRDLPPAVDAPRIDSPQVDLPVRKDPPFSDEPSSRVDPPTMMAPATGGLVGPGGLVGGEEEPPEPPRVDAVRNDPFPAEPPRVEPPAPEEPALGEESRTESRPSPTPLPRRRQDEQPPQEPPSRPRLTPAPAPASGVDKHSQAFVDDILNTQERNLLKELQDELARREHQDTPPQQDSGSWRTDRSGRHGKPATAGPFDHPNQTTGPMIINGVPPYDRGHPPAN